MLKLIIEKKTERRPLDYFNEQKSTKKNSSDFPQLAVPENQNSVFLGLRVTKKQKMAVFLVK